AYENTTPRKTATHAKTPWTWRKSSASGRAMPDRLPDPPHLTDAQRLWLRELGLDRPMLARLARGGEPARDGAGPPQASGIMRGSAASAAVGAVAPTVGETIGSEAGTGLHHSDGRDSALAALAALKRRAGERGSSAPVPDGAEPPRVPPSGEARQATSASPTSVPNPRAAQLVGTTHTPASDDMGRGGAETSGESSDWRALETL